MLSQLQCQVFCSALAEAVEKFDAVTVKRVAECD